MTTYDEPPYDPDYDQPGQRDTTPDAEQAVLGAMLNDPKQIPTVVAILRPSDYADHKHEVIHEALTTLHTPVKPVDAVSLADHLSRQRNGQQGRTQLAYIGGAPYLHDLMQACPITANADRYAELVRDAARRRTIATVATRLQQVARTGSDIDLEQAFTTAYESLDEAVSDFGPAVATPTTWAPVDLTPVLAGDYLDEPPTMLRRSDGAALFYPGSVHTVSGESESGKTWLCLLAALQELDAGNQVTFIDFEDRADRVIARLLSLGARPDQIRERFAYIRPDRPLDDTGRHQLVPAIQNRSLVIIDGVTEAMVTHGLDLNSNADSATFQALLPRWIADHGPAVTLIDHVVKDKEKQDRHAIGAQHKLAGIDGAAYMVKTRQPFGRGKRGIATINVSKDRPGYVRERAQGNTIAVFTLDGSVDDVVVQATLAPPNDGTPGQDTWEPTYLMAKLSRAVQLNPGITKNALEDIVAGKATAKRTALDLLVVRGYIRVEKGPRGALQHHHEKPYTDPQEHSDDDE